MGKSFKIELLEYKKCARKTHHSKKFIRPAGCDTWSMLSWSIIGLNSEFSFSWTVWCNKGKEPSLLYYLPMTGRKVEFILPKVISVM